MTEIVVVVPCQASEAVENFLGELGAMGASIERFDMEGPAETVRGYFAHDKETDQLKRSVEAYLKEIEHFFPSTTPWQSAIRVLSPSDWQEKWKTFFRPTGVTRRLVIKPTWESYEARDNGIVIEIDPGLAFGTGLHPTTRLCLAFLENEIEHRIKESKGLSLLDVGTGSGILAIAAARLGARPVVGIEIDDTAREVARQNVKHNHVEGVVSIDSKKLQAIDETFDLVLANIDAKTLAELRDPLIRHVSVDGRLALSGILREQKQGFKGMFRGDQFHCVGEKSREGWSCLVFERS